MRKSRPAGALGKPGISGDALRILETIDTIIGSCRTVLAIELSICATDPPSNLKAFRDDFRGITAWIIGVAGHFAEDWNKAVEGVRKGSHQFNVTMELKTVPQLQKLLADVEEFKTHPELCK